MKHILLVFMLFSTVLLAQPSKATTNTASYNQLTRDDYVFDPLYRDAETIKRQEAEREALKIKKEKMDAQKKELKAKQEVEQKALQKKNKKAYDKAMKEFENRRKNNNTSNSIIVSDKPI